MRTVPLLASILDQIGITSSTLSSLISEGGDTLDLLATHRLQLTALLAPIGGALAYFSVHLCEDILTFEFLSFDSGGMPHVDFSTYETSDGAAMQHCIEIENRDNKADPFTPAMLEAIRSAPGPLDDRMPDCNGQPLSSVAMVPPILGDLLIATVQDTGCIEHGTEGGRPGWSIPYIRCMTDAAPVEIDESPLPLAA